MSFNSTLSDLQLVWDAYLDFEGFTRDKDGDLNLFIEAWEEKMAKVQSAGCPYSELLLGLKLIEKVNLSRDSIVSVISKLGTSTLGSDDFLSQVVTNIRGQSDINGTYGNLKIDLANSKSRIGFDQKVVDELEIKSSLTSCPITHILDEVGQRLQDDDQDNAISSKKGSRSESVFQKCPICEKNFMLTENLKNHVKKHGHTTLALEDNSYLDQESWIDSPEMDSESPEYESTFDIKIKKEIKNETSEPPDIRKGPDQPSKFAKGTKHNSNVSNHVDRVVPFVPCEICGKSIPKNVIKRHMLTHTADNFKCDICPKEFEKFWMLKRHMECHKTTRDYSCSMCDKTFIRKDALSKHFAKMHTNKFTNSSDQVEKKKVKAPKRQFPCEVCGKSIAEGSMKTHVKKHFNEVHKCSICPNKYSKLTSLEKHMEAHKKRHVCNICQKEFRYSDLLRIHMGTHRATRDFICSYCGKKYKTKDILRKHLNLHTKAKQLPCTQCDKVFLNPNSLKFHIRAHHTGEKPYKCDFCDKRFYTSSKKMEHERTHTGEKPLPCHVCGKYFRCYSSRRRHIMNVHKEVKSSVL